MKLSLRWPLFLIITTSFNKQVQAQCNSAFSYTTNQNQANFTATNSVPNLSHSWRFGDGSLGYGVNTSHIYSLPGSYTVWHIVADSLNTCRDSTAQVVTINFTATCNANFYYRIDSVQYNYYTFIANPTINGGSVQTYSWKIDGVQVSTTWAFSIFLTPGSHQVCLDITTTAGCTANSCQTIIVDTMGNCNWQASFTYAANAVNPRQISFSASPGQSTMRYQWRFGDGYTSSVKDPVHTYAAAGTYNVRLAISDTVSHCFDTVWQTIQVFGLPADSCTASYTYTLNAQGQASFTASSNQTITSQVWTITHFWDSVYTVTISDFNPAYTFTDTGYYNVCVRLTTNTGCVRSSCQGIMVSSISGRQLTNRIPSYPNPAHSEVALNVKLENDASISIRVYNLSGNIVYGLQQQGRRGNNKITIPVGGMTRGQYIIDIKYHGEKRYSVFQKQ